jgi:hypothetical protein
MRNLAADDPNHELLESLSLHLALVSCLETLPTALHEIPGPLNVEQRESLLVTSALSAALARKSRGCHGTTRHHTSKTPFQLLMWRFNHLAL